MSNATELSELTEREYEYGFVTDIESETIPKGLNEEIVRIISAKKEEPALTELNNYAQFIGTEGWIAVYYASMMCERRARSSGGKSRKPGSLAKVEVAMVARI